MLLLGAVHKFSQMERLFEHLRRVGITTAQMHMLLVISSKGDNWVSMPELVSALEKSREHRVVQSSVSRAIQTLSKEGRKVDVERRAKGLDFLEFNGDEEDGRIVYFRLNKKGWRFLDEISRYKI